MTNYVFLLFFLSSFFFSINIHSEILSPESSPHITPQSSPQKQRANHAPHKSRGRLLCAKKLCLNSRDSEDGSSFLNSSFDTSLLTNTKSIVINTKILLGNCSALFEVLPQFKGEKITIEGDLYNSIEFNKNLFKLFSSFHNFSKSTWIELKIKNINNLIGDTFSTYELISIFDLFAQIPLKISIDFDACDFSIFNENIYTTPNINDLIKPFEKSSIPGISGLQILSLSNNTPSKGFRTLANLTDESLLEFFKALSKIPTLKSLCFSSISWVETSLEVMNYLGETLAEMQQLERLYFNDSALNLFEDSSAAFFSNNHTESKNKIIALLEPLATSSLIEFGINYLNDQKPEIYPAQEDFIKTCLPLVAKIKTLKILNLNRSLIEFYHEDTIDSLCSTLQSLSLDKIILTNNKLALCNQETNVRFLKKICSALTSICCLKECILSRNCVSPCQKQLIRRNFYYKRQSRFNNITFI